MVATGFPSPPAPGPRRALPGQQGQSRGREGSPGAGAGAGGRGPGHPRRPVRKQTSLWIQPPSSAFVIQSTRKEAKEACVFLVLETALQPHGLGSRSPGWGGGGPGALLAPGTDPSSRWPRPRSEWVPFPQPPCSSKGRRGRAGGHAPAFVTSPEQRGPASQPLASRQRASPSSPRGPGVRGWGDPRPQKPRVTAPSRATAPAAHPPALG